MNIELIERAELLDSLQIKFESVVDGEGHCILLSGEAGIGKTSLVKAFCKEKKNVCKVYQGTCDALFTPRPLAPIYDIIWQIRSDAPGSNLDVSNRSVLFNQLFHEL